MKILRTICVPAFVLTAGLYGCGGGDETAAPPEGAAPAPAAPGAVPAPAPMPSGISGAIQEKMIEAAAAKQGMDADVEFSGDGMTMKVKDTEHGEVKMGYGAQATLPDSVPEDVPVYEGLALNMVNEVAAKDLLMIMGSSQDSASTIAAFYKEQAAAKGWTLTTENEVPGQAHVLMYEKDGRMLQVMMGPAPGGGTQVTLNTGKN